MARCCSSGKQLSVLPLQLSELMREKRQEVEKDHERKMERMKEEHRQALARIQDQYEEEVLLGESSESGRRRQRLAQLGCTWAGTAACRTCLSQPVLQLEISFLPGELGVVAMM